MTDTDKNQDRTMEPSLDAEPFSYRETKDGKAQLFYNNRAVTTLAGGDAYRFLNKMQRADSKQQQMLMAKATGHFKHGNERMGKQSPKN